MGLLFWVSRDQRCLWSGCPELPSLRNYLKEFSRKNILQVVSFFLHDVAVMLRATVRDHLQPLALNLPGTAFPDKLFQASNAMLHFEKKTGDVHIKISLLVLPGPYPSFGPLHAPAIQAEYWL